MDELDELIEEFEWRASMEGELANSAFAKESFDSFERYKRNKMKYNRVSELLKELKEYRSKDGKPGHWKPCGILHKCSKCGMCFGTKTSFCPNCGADMRVTRESKQPFINKPCISEGVCREDKMQVLDKIRAEIVELTKCPYGTECLGANCPSNTDCMICGDHVLEILDKYKAESEE